MHKRPKAPSSERSYRIGELAQVSGMRIENIRYYEKVGLMPVPRRSAGNYRLYTRAERERLAFIRRCRSLDIGLVEIRRLIVLHKTPAESCADVDRLLDHHIDSIGQKITELQKLCLDLKALRARCRTPMGDKNCAILRELSRDRLSS